jgi:tetratricopeptide (TPR) repeat protein
VIFLRRVWRTLQNYRYFLLIVCLWLPADSPQGAFSSRPNCADPPIPTVAWGALFFPDEPRFALEAGQEMIARSEFASALCFLNLAASAHMNSPLYWQKRGDALWGLGDSLGAVAAWERSNFETPQTLNHLRAGYEKTGQLTKASQTCETLLRLNPNGPEWEGRCALIDAVLSPAGSLPALDKAASNLGPQADTVAAVAAAIRDAERARDPAYLYARTGEALLTWEEAALAEAALRKALALRPDYGDVHALLGLALEKQGGDGDEEYRLGTQLSPNSETACLFYGAWQRRNGHLDLARIWLERAWSLQPGDWVAADELAALEFDSGHVAAGENWLLQSVQIYPNESSAWIALADFYIRHEIQVEPSGIPAARQAVILAPKNPRALELLGRGYFLTGDFTMAETFFRRALSLTPASASLHTNLGRTLLEEGDFVEARIEFEQAVRLDPDSNAGKEAQGALKRLPSDG